MFSQKNLNQLQVSLSDKARALKFVGAIGITVILILLVIFRITANQQFSGVNSTLYFVFGRDNYWEIWMMSRTGEDSRLIYQIPQKISLAEAKEQGILPVDILQNFVDKGMSNSQEFEMSISGLDLSPNKALLYWQEDYFWCPGNYCRGRSGIKLFDTKKEIAISVAFNTDIEHAFYGGTWSPDSRKLVFEENRLRWGYEPHLWILDIATLQTRMIGKGSNASWAPDSRRFAANLVEESKKYPDEYVSICCQIIDNQKDTQTVIKPEIVEGYEGYINPRWSPDGEELALVGIGGKPSPIFLLNLQTQQVTDLTSRVGKYDIYNTSWSPDGKWMRAEASNTIGSRTLIFDVSTGDIVVDAVDMVICDWSDNSKEILYFNLEREDPRKTRFYVLNMSTYQITALDLPNALGKYLQILPLLAAPTVPLLCGTW